MTAPHWSDTRTQYQAEPAVVARAQVLFEAAAAVRLGGLGPIYVAVGKAVGMSRSSILGWSRRYNWKNVAVAPTAIPPSTPPRPRFRASRATVILPARAPEPGGVRVPKQAPPGPTLRRRCERCLMVVEESPCPKCRHPWEIS